MISFAFVSYMAIMSVTPGPNNLLLATSGVHFGFVRTIPQMLGISLGIFIQILLMTVALSSVLGLFQAARPWLAVAGCLYLFYLSWKIFRAGKPGEKDEQRPMTLIEAALFQAVNPKAWVMVVNIAIIFAPTHDNLWWGSLSLAVMSSVVNLPCISLWAATGDRLRKFLSQGKAALIFNATMGLLMAGTAAWLLAEELIRH